ncbi:DUF3005 domain-containing protein [bacterium M00.F.Ca.ET.228.01.1.1]|uniref:DUF3005 domain-containing protein n=1 Tax=Paraburkholderia phenoliruptrix TaxID=252970 RepID=UPI001091A243|nr:DUF3005 domain-containing protein [Paraburkholderia phenoliruptrix]TGP39661.1 DUF3005 domain-containing protein [bacterium M00.F.Ca.ET.228.01.1.1]TGR95494.1 DUF3005 domain-containing protein [bacterium M00.F.Ca.ET.191.01.1.1]TGT96420.1 DUF3005 domain-containing protein [bacterium M00.F.Ca.ET.155.01.1.1]MBW0451122.1 DUF3005 domain-containing protein [Paraburkholderia phenoliruptrix]MBW9101735.1 DUF3005 domain-containing protein [Paraburkholderia phenoliruptrix]
MQNAEQNPTQKQQNEMAAKSPAHTPAAGTASPDAHTQAKEFASSGNAGSAEPSARKDNATNLPPIDLDAITSDSPDPLQRARSRTVSVDTANTASMDNTVDTDGKNLEARKDESAWHDNVISSNATLENSVPAPATGLGGIESRAGGNLPLVAARDGWQVTYRGTVYIERRNGSLAEHVIQFDARPENDKTET